MRIVEIIHAAGKRTSDLGLGLAPLESLVEGTWRAAQVRVQRAVDVDEDRGAHHHDLIETSGLLMIPRFSPIRDT
ncbi:hypothetical protein ACFOWZ_37535 [Lentzea rhizosphaerae]|uniref:Uncharacterized protein n=1 Tax=Lentzea rhizosphaerae TaxID=2041025 RepID=A0ABV8C5D7_9PSEU